MIKKLLAAVLIWGWGFGNIVYSQNYFDKYVTFPDSVSPQVNGLKLIRTKDDALLFFTVRYNFSNYCEILLIKYDTFGNELWTSKITAAQQLLFYGIVELPDSSFALSGIVTNSAAYSGNALMRVAKDGQLLYAKNIRAIDSLANFGHDIALLTDSTLVINSNHYKSPQNTQAGNIITDYYGNVISNSFYNINNKSTNFCKYQKVADGIILYFLMTQTGISNSHIIGLAKIDNSGTMLWAKQITTDAVFNYEARDITQTASGHIILAGVTTPVAGTNPPQRGFICCIDSSGTVSWLKHYNPVRSYWTSVTPYDSTSFIAAGSLYDTIVYQKGMLAQINVNGTIEAHTYFRPDSCRVSYVKSTSGPGTSVYSVFYVDSVFNSKNILMFKKYDSQFSVCERVNLMLSDSSVTPVDSIQWTDTTFIFNTTDITFLFTQFFDTLGIADRCLTTHIETNEPVKDIITVFPNPATDKITISFAATTSGNITVKIYSITGEVVFESENKTTGNNFNKTIEVKDFSNGIYFLSVQTDEGLMTKKMVVNH